MDVHRYPARAALQTAFMAELGATALDIWSRSSGISFDQFSTAQHKRCFGLFARGRGALAARVDSAPREAARDVRGAWHFVLVNPSFAGRAGGVGDRPALLPIAVISADFAFVLSARQRWGQKRRILLVFGRGVCDFAADISDWSGIP